MKDPDFLAEAARQSLDVDPLTGDDIESLISDLYATPRALIDVAASIFAN